MEVQEMVNLVVNQGFAIVVAVYCLTRLEKTMKDHTAILVKLTAKLDRDAE